MIVRELITLLGFKMDDSQLKSYDSKMRMVTTGIGIASAAVTALGGFALKAAGDMEQTQVAFETMMGNAAEAKKFVADMYKMGAETPYESTDLLQNAKVMMQFGLSAKQTKEDLSMLGDVGAGSAVKLQMLTLAYSQISSAGKLQGQDLLQLVNAGFNPLQEISKKTGKSMAQLREDMKDGAISADMVRDAFKSATSQGGRFYKMSEKMSKTLFGRWSTIKDNFSMMMVSVGNAFIGSFGEMMDSIANFMKVNQKLIQSGLGKFFQKLSFVFMVIYVAIKNIIQEMGGLKTIMMVTGGIVYGFIEVTLQTIKILYKLRGVILLVVTTFILYNTVIKAIAAYKFITYWIQLIQMARSFTEVLQLMNLTFITSPAFLWVAGIVAAIAVIYLLIKNWKKVKQFFAGLWKWFSKMLDNPIFVALGVIMMPWITVPALIIKHWKKIVVFFSALWRWFLKLLDNPIIAGLGLILAPFITVPALIVKHWKLIKTFFSALWSWFYKSLNNPILATVGLIFAPLITVPTLIVKHWKTLKTFFLGLWPWFYKMLNNPIFATVSAIFAPLITIPTLIAKNWKPITKLFDTICRGIGKVGGAIMKFLGIKFTKEELATLNGKDSKPKKQGKPPKKVPHYARGTDFVPENQMAYLHKGERILPANFRQNSGGVTNIYQIQSNPKLTVPSDTPKKQAEYLRKVAKETIKTEWQSILRQTVGGNPIPQGS